jgi:hypothetical protein
MTDQQIIAALYSRLNALRLNVGDVLRYANLGDAARAGRLAQAALDMDDRAMNKMHATQFPATREITMGDDNG